MKALLLLPVLLGLIALPAARADQKAEDAALRQRHDEWCATWAKHDPKLMAAFFVAEGDLIDPFGHHANGPAEIEKLFTGDHTGTGVMVGTTYAGIIENIRYLGKNFAIVDVTAEITGIKGPDGAAAPPFKHHVTWVCEKKAGKWMAVAARPCVSVPVPGAAAK